MSNTSTRSGMLWEVERILTECSSLGTMPQVLLMENVPQVHSVDNLEDFNKWKTRLEELGYKNYFQDLIATDYSIPQTRNRCFMVSILGEYNYTFPKPIPLKSKLKDMLEDNVDEKYYLSDKMIEYIYSDDNSGKYNRKAARESCDRSIEKGIAATIPTTAGNRPTDNFIKVSKSVIETLEKNKITNNEVQYIDGYNRKIRQDNLSNTITTRISASNNDYLLIKNATSKGYLEATEGDGIDISGRMEYHRGNVQKDKIQTLTTSGGNDRGVVEKPKVLGGFGKIGSTNQFHQQNRVYDDKLAISVTTCFNPYYKDNLRIRKLTPKECFRLMGVSDEDYEKCAKNQSDSSLYHLAGDSIVVNVLMAIFKEML